MEQIPTTVYSVNLFKYRLGPAWSVLVSFNHLKPSFSSGKSYLFPLSLAPADVSTRRMNASVVSVKWRAPPSAAGLTQFYVKAVDTGSSANSPRCETGIVENIRPHQEFNCELDHAWPIREYTITVTGCATGTYFSVFTSNCNSTEVTMVPEGKLTLAIEFKQSVSVDRRFIRHDLGSCAHPLNMRHLLKKTEQTGAQKTSY